MNTALGAMSELAPQGDTPTLAEVREKIEARYANALGQQELAGGGIEARMLEVRKATIDSAAATRLDAIRASMSAGAAGTPSLEKKSDPAAIEAGDATAPGVSTNTGQEAPPPGV
jgi:phage shock protein A